MDGCPPGQRPEITRAGQRAIVVEVGGRIRRYKVGARLSGPYPGRRPLGRAGLRAGQVLAQPPHPRQLSHRGDPRQVACIKPEARSAIHGSSRWPSPRCEHLRVPQRLGARAAARPLLDLALDHFTS